MVLLHESGIQFTFGHFFYTIVLNPFLLMPHKMGNMPPKKSQLSAQDTLWVTREYVIIFDKIILSFQIFQSLICLFFQYYSHMYKNTYPCPC